MTDIATIPVAEEIYRFLFLRFTSVAIIIQNLVFRMRDKCFNIVRQHHSFLFVTELSFMQLRDSSRVALKTHNTQRSIPLNTPVSR